MPDSVTSSSKVAVQLHAPGGISLGTVQDTSQYSVETLVSLFGTNNVASITHAATQNVNNVVTTQQVTDLRASTRISSSIANGRTKQVVIPSITALSERLHRRGTIAAMFTASRTPAEATEITQSVRIVVEPERQLSADPDIRALYEDTGSYEVGKELDRKVDVDIFDTHILNKEPEYTSPFTHSETTIELSDFSYEFASDGLEDASNVNKKYTNYYIQNDVLYTDERHIDIFNGGGHRYFKVSGSDQAWGITSRAKTYHKYQDGDKEKPTFKLAFNKANLKDNPSGVCVDGDDPVIEYAYWYDKELYKDRNLTENYIINTSSSMWIKNITWDEALLFSASSGKVLDASAC